MSIRFEFFRIFVEDAIQTSLFGNAELTKSEVIEQAFSTEEPVEFSVRGSQLAYVKFYEQDGYIIGSVGRKSVIPVLGPPEKKFELTREENWPHVLIVVNTSSEIPLGQSIAVLKDNSIFRTPINQIKALSDILSEKFTAVDGHILLLESISDKKSFWEMIEAYQGKLQKLTFDLSAPNFLKLNDELSESLKEANKTYNMTNAELSIENKEGQLNIPKDDGFVSQAANYASKGGGDIKLKIKDAGTVSGKSRTITASITTEDYEVLIKGEDSDTVKAICDKLFLCLKDLD